MRKRDRHRKRQTDRQTEEFRERENYIFVACMKNTFVEAFNASGTLSPFPKCDFCWKKKRNRIQVEIFEIYSFLKLQIFLSNDFGEIFILNPLLFPDREKIYTFENSEEKSLKWGFCKSHKTIRGDLLSRNSNFVE